MIYSIFLDFILFIVISNYKLLNSIETYRMNEFPNDKIALHMPCEESNMFATKCKGCNYVLLRNVANKLIATLKRIPTSEEFKRFDPSIYQDMMVNSRDLITTTTTSETTRILIRDLIDMVNDKGKRLIEQLYQSSFKKYCSYNHHNYTTTQSQNPSSISPIKLSQGISLFALNYRAPMTLLNSLRTWNSSGLLDLVDEKIIILNNPFPEEIFMSLAHGFTILQPKDIIGTKHLIKDLVMIRPNVLTIGAAFYEALKRSRNEYILFLENDFKIDTEMKTEDIIMELIAATAMLNRGIEVVRLQSRKYKGCGTHKDCDHNGIHLDSYDVMQRSRNWFAYYCKGHPGSEPYVSDCLDNPLYRCFTSWDSNWSLNAALVKKSTMLNKKYPTSEGMKSIGKLADESFSQQDALETNMMYGVKWMNWKVPICISYQGLFIHEEIETRP